MGGFLYITGGFGAGVTLRSCERYDPASNTWSRIADLPEPRYEGLPCLDTTRLHVAQIPDAMLAG
jgi:hypothetical protein